MKMKVNDECSTAYSINISSSISDVPLNGKAPERIVGKLGVCMGLSLHIGWLRHAKEKEIVCIIVHIPFFFY